MILYVAKHGFKYSPFKKIRKRTSILYNDDVNTMAYVVDKGVFSLDTYIMDKILVLNMWWIGFSGMCRFIHLQHA